jgi:hypothetical protein
MHLPFNTGGAAVVDIVEMLGNQRRVVNTIQANGEKPKTAAIAAMKIVLPRRRNSWILGELSGHTHSYVTADSSSARPQSMRQQPLKSMMLLAACTIVSSLLASCAWSVGGKGVTSNTQPTRGQELIDLQKAKEQGAITAEEYENQKKRILAR